MSSSNKVVEKASNIIAAIENCGCPHCLSILKSGLGNQPNPDGTGAATIPGTNQNGIYRDK